MDNTRLTIVHYDDEYDARLLFVEEMEPEGYAVQSAATPDETVFLVKRYEPDAIVLDMMSAIRKDEGIELYRRLKRENLTSGRPVVMLSNRDDAIAHGLARDTGAEHYVPKDQISECPALIRELVEKQRCAQ